MKVNNKNVRYYDWLVDRFRYSATNNAVISNMSRLIYGKGLDAMNANRKPSEYAQMLSLLPKQVLRKFIKDLKMLGSGSFQVIYNKNHTKILRVEHIPRNLLQPNKCNEDGEIDGYWFSDEIYNSYVGHPISIIFDLYKKIEKKIERYNYCMHHLSVNKCTISRCLIFLPRN